MTEYQKLINMLEVYEKILHPDIFAGIKKQFHAACQEAEQEAMDKRTSKELQELEPLLLQFKHSRQRILGDDNQYNLSSLMFMVRPVVKKIFELYK